MTDKLNIAAEAIRAKMTGIFPTVDMIKFIITEAEAYWREKLSEGKQGEWWIDTVLNELNDRKQEMIDMYMQGGEPAMETAANINLGYTVAKGLIEKYRPQSTPVPSSINKEGEQGEFMLSDPEIPPLVSEAEQIPDRKSIIDFVWWYFNPQLPPKMKELNDLVDKYMSQLSNTKNDDI